MSKLDGKVIMVQFEQFTNLPVRRYTKLPTHCDRSNVKLLKTEHRGSKTHMRTQNPKVVRRCTVSINLQVRIEYVSHM